MAHLPAVNGLIERAIRRDTDAFAELYRLHSQRIFRHVYYITGKKQEADDITSDTFLKAWSAIDRYEDRGVPIENWLLKIAHNLATRYIKRMRPTLPVELAENQAHPSRLPEQVVEAQFEAASVRAAILQLPPIQRQVVIWRFIENMSYAEVEALLGKSQGAIRVIQFRALARMRAVLEASMPGEKPRRARLARVKAKVGAVREPALVG